MCASLIGPVDIDRYLDEGQIILFYVPRYRLEVPGMRQPPHMQRLPGLWKMQKALRE